jgi:hypothetical protein
MKGKAPFWCLDLRDGALRHGTEFHAKWPFGLSSHKLHTSDPQLKSIRRTNTKQSELTSIPRTREFSDRRFLATRRQSDENMHPMRDSARNQQVTGLTIVSRAEHGARR